MGQDVDAAQPLKGGPGQRFAAFRCGQIRLDIFNAFDPILDRASGCNDMGSTGKEAFDGSAAQALGAAADEYALAGELVGIYRDIHTETFRVLMVFCASVKR